ncbi:hypothetical protein DY218_12600 [Streptomyces triticagri]|uniref:Uncharacterized protein n=1 Tax=Streptomyces triticagri TaxID=2293568 RepID=A0A372M631_9ACTN|nr:hypothetical protein [Streptomyces triticagri]RFU86398.1 hypothetical protein DY218_12600 [Streptomyces triticagri]
MTVGQRARIVCGLVSAALFGWMVWTFCAGPDFEFGKAQSGSYGFEARCEPLLWGVGVSWGGTPGPAELGSSPHRGFDVVEGELPGSTDGADAEERLRLRTAVVNEVARYCDRARDGQSALIGIAAVPAAALAAAAFLGRSSAGRREG